MKGKREPRLQEGVMHVAFRGNAKFTVFYDDDDKIMMLRYLQRELDKFSSTLYEFCIMSNHCHLMLQTDCLTKMMTVFLREYSRWHNRKYNLSEKLFGTPFLSTVQFSENHMISKCAYILNNPVEAGICAKPQDYFWSSAKMHFGKCDESPDSLPAPQRLSDIITVDTTICDRRYEDFDDFMRYVVTSQKDAPKEKSEDIFSSKRIDDKELLSNAICYISKQYSKQNLNMLKPAEADDLIKYLRTTTTGSIRQIASLLHDSQERIKR